jgi:hypothetical protein
VVRETCLEPEMSITLGAGVLTAEKAHGGLAIQSLHVWSQMCVASLAQDLLHALHINLFAIARVIFTNT